ncbi:MAG: hypothetical protein RIQ47_697 [Bacteroidota bacterium]|jgi:hypothetical protein
MQNEDQKRILLAPLDWGLGHATRCIPLIREWLSEGNEVILAADGATAELLRSHFPNCRIVSLRGYNIHYSNRLPLLLSLLFQLPKFLNAIRGEKIWLANFLTTEHIDLIVSDNRYGFHNKAVKSIIITHQLFVQVPVSLRFLKKNIHRKILKYIAAFDECWIPDKQGVESLSGDLSQEQALPAHAKFIGWLSRFDNTPISKDLFETYDQLILLSGPEPLRTTTENKLFAAALVSGEKTLLVQGKPFMKSIYTKNNVTVVSHLDDDALKHALLYSKKITCRAGYSTLMDLKTIDRLGKNVHLLPTPGQTEQEYLANRLLAAGVVNSR